MGELLKHLIDFIRDRTTSWGFKTALFVSLIGIIFIVDYYIGFSYNYHLNNKIEQIEKIQKLKMIYSNDSINLAQINSIEKRVLDSKHYAERITNLFANNHKIQESVTSKPNLNEENQTYASERSLFWMTFSSNYLLLIISPFLLFLPLYSKESRNGNTLVGWFASLIMTALLIILITWVAYQIPTILGNPLYNYALNFSIHTIFWILIYKISKKKNSL